MGVIELQVFVSLVVILGAAFVALICDFLKGNNEQLRESNIVLRVREDERTRREELVERVQQRVQRQTIEVLTQVQRVSGQRPVVAAKPQVAKPASEQPVEQPAAALAPAAAPVPAAATPTETVVRGYAERSGRVRRPRPAPASAEAPTPVPVRTDADATWAQDIILRRHPQAEVKPEPLPQPEVQPEPRVEVKTESSPEPVRPVPAPQFEAFDIRHAAPARVFSATPAPESQEAPPPELVSAQQPLPIEPLSSPLQPTALATAPEPVEFNPAIPVSGAQPELHIEIVPDPLPELAPETAPEQAPEPAMASATEIPLAAAAPVAAEPIWSGSPVLNETAASVPQVTAEAAAPLAPALAGAAGSTQSPVSLPASPAAIVPGHLAPAEVSSAVPLLQLQAEAPDFEVADPALATPRLDAEPQTGDDAVQAAQPEEPQVVRVRVLREDEDLNNQELLPEPEEAAAEPVILETAPTIEEPLSPAALETEPWLEPAAQETAEPVEVRSNVVQMPVSPLRPQETEKTAVAELVIPGGFHEATSLARLMEDDRPFHGLVLAISVVDHVRLLADQGKPATEQLMASVTRLVVSMAREQDFVCRIGDDEFILIFGRETGAAAKRRVQLVSERLWDFQLRSLGSVSVIFSWGASESQSQPLMQTVENAREQMIDTRRNRRAYNTGASRFNRRAAN
jgi:GGDEF domain-containing protein